MEVESALDMANVGQPPPELAAAVLTNGSNGTDEQMAILEAKETAGVADNVAVIVKPEDATLGEGDVAVAAAANSGGVSDTTEVEAAPTHMVQVTNIAPQATRDQMVALFSMLGSPVDDLRLYPTVRDASVSVQSRCAFIKFGEHRGVDLCQHLNNTVFIDRAIIVTPLMSNEMPDEELGLQMAASTPGPSSMFPHRSAGGGGGDPLAKLPPHVTCRVEGVPPHAVIVTHDPKLDEAGLPAYPPLPATMGAERVEEIRRTVVVVGQDNQLAKVKGFFPVSRLSVVQKLKY